MKTTHGNNGLLVNNGDLVYNVIKLIKAEILWERKI